MLPDRNALLRRQSDSDALALLRYITAQADRYRGGRPGWLKAEQEGWFEWDGSTPRPTEKGWQLLREASPNG